MSTSLRPVADPKKLEPFFLAQKGRRMVLSCGNDSWALIVDGLYGRQFAGIERVNVHLYMTAIPTMEWILAHSK